MKALWSVVRRFRGKGRTFLTRDEEGASLVEYALLVALIALIAIAAVKAVGGSVANAYTQTKNALDGNGVGNSP